MAKKPRIMVVPADSSEERLKQFKMLETSLRKFHSEKELPLIRVDESATDKQFWLRKTPVTAHKFAKEFEVVIAMDCDQIILGDLSELWEANDADITTVLNDPTYPIGVWDIGNQFSTPYYNGALMVLKEGDFLDKFYRLSVSDHISRYRYSEQDLMNVLASDYYDYKVRCMDYGDSIWGEFAKPKLAQATLEDGKVMIDGKQLRIAHFGGGFEAKDKMNYRIRFQKPVADYVDSLLK